MTSLYRSRERDMKKRNAAGSKTVESVFYWNGSPFGSPSETVSGTGDYPPGHELCQDRVTVAGPYNPNPLSIEWRDGKACSLSGEYSFPEDKPKYGNQYTYRYANYFDSRLGSMWNTGVATLPAEDPGFWLTDFLSKTSLTKPDFNTPLFLWELMELPRLIQYTGSILKDPRKAANPGDAWLAYNFGWAPLFSDLEVLWNISDYADKRFKSFVNARSQGRERRSLKSDYVDNVVGTHTIETVQVEILDKITTKVWATGQWILDDPYKVAEIQRLADLNQGELARMRYLLGLRYSRATIWEMIPWSWFIDYLANIGSFLEATDNHVGVALKNVCIMIETTGQERSRVVSNPNELSFIPHLFERSRKERFVYSDPSAQLRLNPVLSGARLANLAALLTGSRLKARFD